MPQYLTSARRAAIFASLHTPGVSNREIALAEGVSERYVRKLRSNQRLYGQPWPEARTPQNATKLVPAAEEELLELLLYKPDLYLDEMQYFLQREFHIYVSTETIRRHIRSANFTNKRLHKIASQRNDELRLAHVLLMSQYTAEMVVFCDESGLDKRDGARRTGWAPRGREATVESAFVRGTRWHMLPALTVGGILDLLVFQGHTNTEGFLEWLEAGVLPKMNQFPGPNSILVMDNASWHRDLRVPALCARFKILLIYLPPYSPDYNPIEAYFGDCKSLIRRAYQYNSGDEMTNGEFKEFIRACAMERGANFEAIAGHYRQAQVPFREQNNAVEYSELYHEQLAELLRWWIAKGYVE